MCLSTRSYFIFLMGVIRISKFAYGQTDSPHSQNQSPTGVTQMDWDKFDFMYTLDDQSFRFSSLSPPHSPHQRSPQYSHQLSPRFSYQLSQEKPQRSQQHSPRRSPIKQVIKIAGESKKRTKGRNWESEKERLLSFKLNDPEGYKEYNRQKYLKQKPRRKELKSSFSEEKKKKLRAMNSSYQFGYRQRIKAQTGYTKLVDKRYHTLQDLVKQNKASPEQIDRFETEREKRRDAVRMSRLRRKLKTQDDTQKTTED